MKATASCEAIQLALSQLRRIGSEHVTFEAIKDARNTPVFGKKGVQRSGLLRLCASNKLDATARIDIVADVKKNGIGAVQLTGLRNAFSSRGDVELSLFKKYLGIKAGRSDGKAKRDDAHTVKMGDPMGEPGARVRASAIASAVARLSYASGDKPLAGTMLAVKKGRLIVAATDMLSLAFMPGIPTVEGTGSTGEVVVARRAGLGLEAFSGIEEPAKIWTNTDRIAVKTSRILVELRLKAAEWPHWYRVVPPKDKWNFAATHDSKEFERVVRLASLFADDKECDILIDTHVSDDLVAASSSVRKGEITIGDDKAWPRIDAVGMRVNHRFLRGALNCVAPTPCTVEVLNTGQNDPIYFRGEDGTIAMVAAMKRHGDTIEPVA